MLGKGTDMEGTGRNRSDRGNDNITIRTLQPVKGKLLFRSAMLLIAYN